MVELGTPLNKHICFLNIYVSFSPNLTDVSFISGYVIMTSWLLSQLRDFWEVSL